MSPEQPAPPRLVVVGVDRSGTEVIRLLLGHGQDPTGLLAAHGWGVSRAREVISDGGENPVLTMVFVVAPQTEPQTEPQTAPRLSHGGGAPRDEDLVMSDSELPEPHQRVAAYAVVTSTSGVLMTQFSDRTNAEGRWGLPGGGIEGGEAPELAVVREAWEESGQVIEVSGLALIQSSRWIGRAPTGRLEDFHAVRVVYRAVCHEPTDPVVHDVGGTTASAAWVSPTELDRLDVTPSWRSLLREVARSSATAREGSDIVMATDEADGSNHEEHGPDHDDRTRAQT